VTKIGISALLHDFIRSIVGKIPKYRSGRFLDGHNGLDYNKRGGEHLEMSQMRAA
jgi:hypothetical protein